MYTAFVNRSTYALIKASYTKATEQRDEFQSTHSKINIFKLLRVTYAITTY